MPSISSGCWNAVPDPVDRVHELRDTFEGKKLALNRHDDRIGRDQGVQGKQVQRGWAVDQIYRRSRSRIASERSRSRNSRFGRSTSSRFAPTRFLSARDEIDSPSKSVATWRPAERIAEKDVIQARPVGSFRHPETRRGVPLWIRIDDQDLEIVCSQRGGQIDGGRGFSYSALLVGDREYSAQAVILTRWKVCFT